MADTVEGLVKRLRDYAENDDHERLCQGREYSCTCGYDDKRDPLLREAASALEALVVERDRLQALVEDKLEDTRLVSAGPKGGGFGFDLMGGPIPYIAEYLFQFIGARDEDKPMSNYAEIEVNHREFGGMTLTLQRHSGQTPHQLRLAAEAQRDKLQTEIDAARLFGGGYFADIVQEHTREFYRDRARSTLNEIAP